MTNQAKAEAMRKGNTIKDLTSSNVMLVKPSQDCQEKEEFNGITSTKEYDLWVHKLPKDKLFTIAEVSDIVAVANFWKLQEQAKEIIQIIDETPFPERLKSSPNAIMLIAVIMKRIREKYGVKEEEK